MQTSKAIEEPVIGATPAPSDRPLYHRLKRGFDLFFSVLGLLCFAPVAIVIAVAIKLTSPGPILYRQVRIGQRGRPFSILKFRSMVPEADKAGPAVTKDGDARITPIGRVLRRTKLDEFPQLWNVLKGDMSFVGPRPEVPRYVDRYTPEQRQLLEHRPGITDLATLVFRDEETLLRNAANVEEFYVEHCIPRKFKLNQEYARRANLLEDVIIILETLCPYWVGVACGYALILAISLWLAYQLRHDFNVPTGELEQMKRLGLFIIPAQLFFLFRGRQLSGLLSYFDVTEMKRLALGLGQSTVVFLVIWFMTHGDFMPGRSIVVMDGALALLMLVGVRTGLRNLRRTRQSRLKPLAGGGGGRGRGGDGGDELPVAIIGAGELGGWLARQFNSAGQSRRRVVAFFDDDPDKWNLQLCDVPVVGMPECLLDGSWQGKLQEVVVAMPSAKPERMQQILSILAAANIRARTLPSIDELFADR